MRPRFTLLVFAFVLTVVTMTLTSTHTSKGAEGAPAPATTSTVAATPATPVTPTTAPTIIKTATTTIPTTPSTPRVAKVIDPVLLLWIDSRVDSSTKEGVRQAYYRDCIEVRRDSWLPAWISDIAPEHQDKDGHRILCQRPAFDNCMEDEAEVGATALSKGAIIMQLRYQVQGRNGIETLRSRPQFMTRAVNQQQVDLFVAQTIELAQKNAQQMMPPAEVSSTAASSSAVGTTPTPANNSSSATPSAPNGQ